MLLIVDYFCSGYCGYFVNCAAYFLLLIWYVTFVCLLVLEWLAVDSDWIGIVVYIVVC